MERFYDEFSKSLAASVPRRESLKRIGAIFAGAVLSPWGLESAWAKGPDPCKTFCNRCRNKTQQNQCLAACQKCNGNTSRLGGSCGGYVCCSTASCSGVCSDLTSDPNCGACGIDCREIDETCCGNYCADLANDVDNCGTCGATCDAPGPYETVACISGRCFYNCVEGADDCGDGVCIPLGSDPDNCGACGNVCAESTPYCDQGTCSGIAPCPGGQTMCSGVCTNLNFDTLNCGACGVVCAVTCSGGVCQDGW